MSQSQAPSETLAKHVALMGSNLGPAFFALSQDVTLAFAERALYAHLYGKPEHVAMLNDVGPGLFGVLQRTLLLDLVLHAARLVDRADTVGRENLTLQSLTPLVADEVLKAEVDSLVQSSCDDCVRLTDWRNRRLAHRDLLVALNVSDRPLPEIGFEEVDRVLPGFANILNRLESHYENGATTPYELFGQSVSAEGLFHFVGLGLDAESKGAEL